MSNSFVYTNVVGLLNIVSNSTFYLYNTIINNTYYIFVKNKFIILKNKVFPFNQKVVDQGVHVDSDNLFLDTSHIAKQSSNKTVHVDTDIKLNNK
jgi:hypothetical protein